jgi:hypothetical protein
MVVMVLLGVVTSFALAAAASQYTYDQPDNKRFLSNTVVLDGGRLPPAATIRVRTPHRAYRCAQVSGRAMGSHNRSSGRETDAGRGSRTTFSSYRRTSSVDTLKPAIDRQGKTGHHRRATETTGFYFATAPARKSVATFVRQLRGPHFRTWA